MPVSYTHLDVYKRQDVDNLLTSFYQLDDEARKEVVETIQFKLQYHRAVSYTHLDVYKRQEAQDKNRVYYEYYHLDGTEEIPVDYKEISFVCLRPDGCLELPSTLKMCIRDSILPASSGRDVKPPCFSTL